MKWDWYWVGWGGGILIAAVALYFVDPVRTRFLPACLLYQITGLHCPGCGSTRALHQLTHGNLSAAFRFNPLTILALPVLGFLVVRRENVFVKPVWVWVALSVVVGFGVLRNIPIYPFTLLVP